MGRTKMTLVREPEDKLVELKDIGVGNAFVAKKHSADTQHPYAGIVLSVGSKIWILVVWTNGGNSEVAVDDPGLLVHPATATINIQKD